MSKAIVIERKTKSHVGIKPEDGRELTDFAIDELGMFANRLIEAGLDSSIVLAQLIQFAGTIKQRIEFKPDNGRFFPRG